MAQTRYGNAPAYFGKRHPHLSTRISYQKAFEELNDFQSRIKAVDPLVIDYFLGQNLHLEMIGKFLIAWAILLAESKEAVAGNYIRHITHAISLGCQKSQDIHKNNVKFVTFNYDTTLERRIISALSGLNVFAKEDIDAFCSKDRFLHVYGAVNDGQQEKLDFSGIFKNEHSLSETLNNIIKVIDQVFTASEKLLVIDPANKNVADYHKRVIRNTIQAANTLIIIGFGFDRFNTDLLDLENLKHSLATERVLMTNYNDINRVNQMAGKAFMHSKTPIDTTYKTLSNSVMLHKSVRNADDSLTFEFDIE